MRALLSAVLVLVVTGASAQTQFYSTDTHFYNVPTSSLAGSIMCAQMPALTGGVSSLAGSCGVNIVSVPPSAIPYPTASTLGGVLSGSAPLHSFLSGITTGGAIQYTQPGCADLSNSAASCAIDATSAANDTFTPAGTGATATTVQAKLRESVSILDFGGDPTGTSDNSTACQNALASFPLNVGGTLVFPVGTYKFTASCNIPAFVEPAIVTLDLNAANLNAVGSISIFKRLPANQTVAESLAGAIFRFNGGVLQGDGVSSGSSGIYLGPSYNSVIDGTYVRGFDAGIRLVFSLNAQLRNVRAIQNITNDVRIESGSGNWTGGTVNNSASNNVTLNGFRTYSLTGTTANVNVLAADGVRIADSVFEGNNPVCNMSYDDQGSTTVKNFIVDNIHQENIPTKAIICLSGTGGAVFSINHVYTATTSPLLDITGIGLSTFNISNIPYAGNFSPAFNLSAGEIYGYFFHFENWGPGNSDMTNPAWWQSGRVPINLIAIQREPGGNGGWINGNYINIGTPNNVASQQEGVFLTGNFMYSVDNTYHFGKVGAYNARPLDATIGTGGLTSAGLITGSAGFGLTNMFASATAPTITSGFCTSPSISASNGTAAFTIHIGTACAASSGVLTMPSANGWKCDFHNVTTPASNVVEMSAQAATSVTVQNYARTTGVAGNFTAGDTIVGGCAAY